MKPQHLIWICTFCASLPAPGSLLLLGNGSEGSDGTLTPTTSIEIDLSQAVDGEWDADNTAHAGQGIHDPEKWVVVFKYSEVTVPEGVTVTFKNHPSRAPVIWIVNGNVTIDGRVSVDGKNPAVQGAAAVPTEAGPGGFRGGCARPDQGGAGMGPQGGNNSRGEYNLYYGNEPILPAIGGSGGAGNGSRKFAGSGAGGCIVIACAETLSIGVTGYISANSGYRDYAHSGSGGAIRLIADRVEVMGKMYATALHNGNPGYGAVGRIRIESRETAILTPPVPIAPAPVVAVPDDPVLIVQPDNSPTVRIAKVALPADIDTAAEIVNPLAPLEVAGDVEFPLGTAGLVIGVETTNFPVTNGRVFVRIAEKFGGVRIEEAAFHDGDYAAARWRTSATEPIVFSDGFTVLQARATGP